MSTIAEPPTKSPGSFNARAFVAGGTATTVLIAAAVIVFASLAAYVAFNGLPGGGGDSGTDSVTLGVPDATAAPDSAAATPGPGPGAGAASPARQGTAPATSSSPGGGAGTDVPAGEVAVTAPTADVASNPGGPTVSAAAPGEENGTVGNAVDDVRGATGGGGGLEDVVGDAVGPVNDAVSGTLGEIGGGLENTNLGGSSGG